MPRLDPSGDPVEVDTGVFLRTPGLDGDANSAPGSAGTRSAALMSPTIDAAFAEHGLQTLHTIEIDNAVEQPGVEAPSNARATRYNEDAIVLEVPGVSEDYAQVVFMQDEAGVITWTFAQPEDRALTAMRGGGTTEFVLRRYVPAPAPGDTRRGLIGAIGTKVIKVLSVPIRNLGGAIATSLATGWERDHRPYGLRVVDPATYATDRAGMPIDKDWWPSAKGQPVLLLVHGTFSRSSSTYGGLGDETFKRLHQSYNGRVVAFDHPTMTETPRENIAWLLERVPPDTEIVVDVISHSRGGLVARTLSEKLDVIDPSRRIAVRNIVLTAAPDNGTALADADHMSDFLDAYTNLINFFPDSTGVDIFRCIVAAVQELAAGALDHLVGLQSMRPSGDFQRWLNVGEKGKSTYYAVGANFAPDKAGLKEWAEQRLMGAIFKAENDLVVPMDGVYGENGSKCFPIAVNARLVFDHGEGVNHCTYFGREELRSRLDTWLPG